MLAEAWWAKGQRDRCFEHLERAQELVRTSQPTPAKARVLCQLSRFRMLAGDFGPGQGREAFELAEEFGLDELRAHMLITIGSVKTFEGDPAGTAQIQRGLDIALAGNWLDPALRGYSNLASALDLTSGDRREALRLALESEKIAERLGSNASRRWARGNTIGGWFDVGDWDRCVQAADEFLAESERVGPHYLDAPVRAVRALIRMTRGELRAALEDQATALAEARPVKDLQVVFPALGISAVILVEAGRIEEARALVDELLAAGRDAVRHAVVELVWTSRPVGRTDEVRAALANDDRRRSLEAARMAMDGEFERAAERFEAMSALPHAALARLRAAEQLAAAGRRAEADAQLRRALPFWRSVGATRYVREAEALLAAAS